MGIAKGSSKQLRLKRQTGKGLIADGSTGGQIMRRTTAAMNLSKDIITNEAEQTSRRQVMSSRHGAKAINGALSGILSCGTYADPLAALLMREWTAVAAMAGISVTIAGAGPTYTVTRAAGDWLAGGAKIGRVVRLGVAALNALNLNTNLLILGATATVLTVMTLNKKALFPEGPIAGVTATIPGAVTYVPETGHTNVYYTAEEWYPEVPRSEVSIDVKYVAATLRLPGSGNAGIDFTAMGLDRPVKGAAVYFTNPALETTTKSLVAASGALVVNGTVQGVVTDLSITLDGRGALADPVVGTNIRPDVFTGKLAASGSFTAYFDGGTVPDLYDDEVQTSIVSALAAASTNNAEFMTIVLSAVKLNSANPDDVETGLKRTYNFSATFNDVGGAALATQLTTVEMQDSAVVGV